MHSKADRPFVCSDSHHFMLKVNWEQASHSSLYVYSRQRYAGRKLGKSQPTTCVFWHTSLHEGRELGNKPATHLCVLTHVTSWWKKNGKQASHSSVCSDSRHVMMVENWGKASQQSVCSDTRHFMLEESWEASHPSLCSDTRHFMLVEIWGTSQPPPICVFWRSPRHAGRELGEKPASQPCILIHVTSSWKRIGEQASHQSVCSNTRHFMLEENWGTRQPPICVF